MGASWRRLGHPRGVQSYFKLIEKALVFIAFLSIQVIWRLSEGSWAASGGPWEVLVGVILTQGRTSADVFVFCKRKLKGSTAIDL